jgi:DNA-binding NarL/FixJ family response regulator
MCIRVAIIDDHPLVVRAVERELGAQSDIQVVGKAEHGSRLMNLVHDTLPDVVVLDLAMSEGQFEPVSAIQKLLLRYPQVRVLVLTGQEDATWMRQIIDAGAVGYVLKSDGLSLDLAKSIRTVYEGKRFYSPAVLDKLATNLGVKEMTDKEMAVLVLAADGLSNTAIAQETGLAEQTVCNYLTNIYKKLGVVDEAVNPRVAAVNKARELGWLP